MARVQFFLRSVGKALLLAGLLVGVGVGAWCLFFQSSDFDKAMRAFRQAYQTNRVIDARVSALPYAPRREVRGDPPATADQVRRARAQAALVKINDQNPSPESENALGQFYLVNKQFDEAIAHLDKAVRLSPGNARFHSDLAAALLEKGKADDNTSDADSDQAIQGQSLKEFGQALEQAEAALRLQPALSEALYNRALCCQQLMLWNKAKQDWQSYLDKDATTPWAEEARKNLDWAQSHGRQERPVDTDAFTRFVRAHEDRAAAAAGLALRQAHSANGNATVDELIGAILARPGEAKDLSPEVALDLLAYAAQIEKTSTGDAYLYDLWQVYRRSGPTERRIIASARRELSNAYQRLMKLDGPGASSGYEKARRLFLAAGDGPESWYAAYWAGRCYVLRPNIEKALPILQRVIKVAETKRYPDLRARALYALAMLQTNLLEYSAAVATSQQSEKLFQLAGDTQNIARATIQIAQEHQEVNDSRRSLAYARRVLRIATESGLEDSLQWQACGLLAFNFDSLGFMVAALDCWKEALNFGKDHPLLASRTYGYLGTVYAKLQDYDQAIDSAAAALDIGTSLETDGQNIVAHSCLMLGDIHRRAGNYQRAIEFYDRSAALYKALGLPLYDYPVHKGKLLAYLALGDDNTAEAEMQAALTLMEQFRAKILENSKRDAFFDAEQDLYDIAIDFAYTKKQDAQRAFDLSEESRARSFLDLSKAKGRVEASDGDPDLKFASISHPLGFAGVQKGLPEQAQLVQYAVLKDRLVVWVISKTGLSSHQTPVAAEQLEGLVSRYLNAASQPEPDAARADEMAEVARELYSILISPIEPFLDRDKQICIVPDKWLNALPFGALISPVTGSYLLQDHLLMSAPSATLFEFCSESAARKADGRVENLLVVARPSFDRRAYPQLGDLPDSGREADQIKGYYQKAMPLIGKQASRASVLSQIREADVLHFATHSITDAASPLRSRLLLTATEHGGAIEAADIYGLKLARPRLAVLSSCKSGVEGINRGEGAISLARPFIAAGVPVVIASLHEVDSAATANLMIAFHKYRKVGRLSSVEALRRAQLDMIDGSISAYRHPFYWAAFVAYGGYAQF